MQFLTKADFAGFIFRCNRILHGDRLKNAAASEGFIS